MKFKVHEGFEVTIFKILVAAPLLAFEMRLFKHD